MKVTAGILEENGRVLIARRRPGRHMAGKWEFPGRQDRAGGNPRAVTCPRAPGGAGRARPGGELLCRASYDGEGVSLELLVFRVEGFDGRPVLREHEEIRWVLPGELRSYDLADSDRRVVEVLYG